MGFGISGNSSSAHSNSISEMISISLIGKKSGSVLNEMTSEATSETTGSFSTVTITGLTFGGSTVATRGAAEAEATAKFASGGGAATVPAAGGVGECVASCSMC